VFSAILNISCFYLCSSPFIDLYRMSKKAVLMTNTYMSKKAILMAHTYMSKKAVFKKVKFFLPSKQSGTKSHIKAEKLEEKRKLEEEEMMYSIAQTQAKLQAPQQKMNRAQKTVSKRVLVRAEAFSYEKKVRFLCVVERFKVFFLYALIDDFDVYRSARSCHKV